MNNKLISVVMASMFALTSANAETFPTKKVDANGNTLVSNKTIEVEAGADLDVLGVAVEGIDTFEAVRLSNAYVTVKANVGKNLIAKLTLELEQLLRINGVDVPFTLPLERFVKEAQIIIQDIGGVPFAILVGKGEVPFAQNYSAMPMHDDLGVGQSQLKIDQKYMVAIKLDARTLKFIDSLEASVFETDNARDLDLGTVDGASVRIGKKLWKNLKVTGSYAYLGNDDNFADEEHRVSLGVIYEDGNWAAWAEGMLVQSDTFFRPEWVALAGVAYQWGIVQVAAEYQRADFDTNAINSIGLGANIAVAPGVKLGPQANYYFCDNGCGDLDAWTFGGRMSVRTSNSEAPMKRKNIGGGDFEPLK